MDVTCTCGKTFEARSAKARYCSDRCRKRKGREDATDAVVAALPARGEGDAPDDSAGAIARATRAELEAVGRLDTALGQACVALARRLDFPGLDTGSALAAVARQLEATMQAATRGAGKASGPALLADQLAERRARRQA